MEEAIVHVKLPMGGGRRALSKAAKDLEARLSPPFAAKHVAALVKHYSEGVAALQRRQWQLAVTRTGQFVEAALKALVLHTGGTLPPNRQFKVGSVVHTLKQLPVGSHSDSIRITIPRACEFIYDVASNRGARHDPDEVDPNEMDAHATTNTASWILAELVRFAQKRSAVPSEVSALLAALVERQLPIVEEVDGRAYFHLPGLSARQLALLALWYRYPARLSRAELLATLQRHRVSANNAATAVARVAAVVDEAADGLRLLQPGMLEVESLIMEKGG